MKNMNRKISLALVLSMIFALILGVSVPIVGYASDETVYINNSEYLIDFAKMSAKGDIPEFEYGHI